MTGCAMLPADHDKRYGLRTLRAREHRSKRVHASSSILRAPSHVSSFVVARCLLALFMFDVPALARIHERCTHDSVRRLREVVSFPLWFAPSPSKPAGKRTNNVARDGVPGVRGEGTGGHADSGPVGERRKSNRPRIDSERGACGVGRGACPCIGRGSLNDKTSSSFGQGVPVHRESPPYARMPLPW